mgnify:CR=1 FL=1
MMLISEIAKKVQAGELKAVDLVKKSLARAADTKSYNALLYVTEERALKRAAEIDAKVTRGEKVGVLAGVPFVNKDNILAFDGPTTAASHMLENFQAPLQATVIEKLEAAGAICVGRANLDSFAHGSSTENSAFGPSKNAVDSACVPGGSSGGSAVAVALDIVPFALGTDTGGSIRQPASFNGVVGVKPTYGLVSRFGAIAMGSSTDCIGCFAKNATDADLVLSVMAGQDKHDMTTFNSNYQAAKKLTKKPRLAVIKQFSGEGLDDCVVKNTTQAIEKLKAAGYEITEVDIPELKYALAVYYVAVMAEVASNLGRYDGVRYGYRSQEAKSLEEVYKLSRSAGFETENKRRIMIGNYVLASGYYDAYYLQAQKVRTLIIKALKKVFANYDFLIGAVVPTPAFKFGDNTSDPLKMYLQDVLTTPANLVGLPALSLPNGVSPESLPIGLQIMGDLKSDDKMLALAREIEVVLEGK